MLKGKKTNACMNAMKVFDKFYSYLKKKISVVLVMLLGNILYSYYSLGNGLNILHWLSHQLVENTPWVRSSYHHRKWTKIQRD